MKNKNFSFRMLLSLTIIFLACYSEYSFSQEQEKNESAANKVEGTNLKDLSLDELLNTPINVSSSQAKNIFQTPSSVSVIDAKMIKEYNFKSVADALNYIEGIQVTRTYLKRDITNARGILQDHYANKVLILINGVASWNAVTGEGSIDRINIHDVERIEVLKGPASVLYGTNAYTGAVNIVLKASDKESVQTYFGIGTNGVFEAGGNYSYSADEFKLFISGNVYQEDGEDNTFTDEKNITGHYKEYMKPSNFNLNVSYKEHSLLFNTFVSHESYLGVDPNFSSGIGNDEWSNGYLLAYKFNHKFSEALELDYLLSYDWSQRNLSRTLDDNTRSDLEGSRIYNSLKFNYKPTSNLNVESGVDYDFRKSIQYMNYNVQKDSILTENDMNGRHLNEYSVFIQADYSISSFNLLAGTRYTHNELFGGNISSRATLVYALNDKNSIKLIWGQSYRAPSLFELYFHTASNTVYGNTSLEPEKSNSLELAYLVSFGKIFVQALVYHANYDNKIFRVKRLPDSPTDKSTIYVNGSAFNANGLELEMKYQNSDLADVFATYTYTNGSNGDERNNDGNYNFKYIPQHILSSGISKKIDNYSSSLLINYISKTYGPKSEIPAFVIFNLNIGLDQKIGNINLTHNLSVENLFDKMEMFPEFSRGNINEVPSGYGRRIVYEMVIHL